MSFEEILAISVIFIISMSIANGLTLMYYNYKIGLTHLTIKGDIMKASQDLNDSVDGFRKKAQTIEGKMYRVINDVDNKMQTFSNQLQGSFDWKSLLPVILDKFVAPAMAKNKAGQPEDVTENVTPESITASRKYLDDLEKKMLNK